MQDFSSLEIELLKVGYRKIYYLEIECWTCGSWRIVRDAIFEPPEGHFPCPRCSSRVPCSPILCVGFTRREMPIPAERFRAPLSCNSQSWVLTEFDEVKKIRKEQKAGQGRKRHYKGEINAQD